MSQQTTLAELSKKWIREIEEYLSARLPNDPQSRQQERQNKPQQQEKHHDQA